jgi:hypothetical protein
VEKAENLTELNGLTFDIRRCEVVRRELTTSAISAFEY